MEPLLKEIFTIARAIDPDVLLFYNDYSNTVVNAKSTAAYNMMLRLKAANVPIDGIGEFGEKWIGHLGKGKLGKEGRFLCV